MQLINPVVESNIKNFEAALGDLAEKIGETSHQVSEKLSQAKKTTLNLVAGGAVLLTTVFLYKKLKRR